MSNRAEQLVACARAEFESGVTKPIEWRIQQLRRLHDLLTKNEEQLKKAVYEDLRKPPFEVLFIELTIVKNDIINAIKNIHEWVKPTYANKSLIQKFDTMYIEKDPLGVVLILGAWNYPILVLFAPLVGAIAAGNCAVLKPSEIGENTSALFTKLIPQYLDKKCFPVYNGGIPETSALLQQRFDLIFYTGSSAVGKIIMTAAAKHLTPVVLEMGGKSPVYVGKDVHMDIVANRIFWGKMLNSGQTCVAPDYVICDQSVVEEFIACSKNVLTTMLGKDPKDSADYGRIINDRNFSRLTKIIDAMPKEKLVLGGERDAAIRYIAPTIFRDVTMDDEVMQSELFGPVLPIVAVANEEEAIKLINGQEKPLALYIFSNNNEVVEKILANTSSGGVTVNDVMMHNSSNNLPFGGVGNSGMGRYYGKWTFDTFTHERSVCWRKQNLEFLMKPRYMPYTENNLKTLVHLTAEKERGYCNIL